MSISSVKFRSTDLVTLIITYQNNIVNDITFEIGPIINRIKNGWSTYSLILPNDTSIDQKLSLLDSSIMIHKPNLLIISYELFKNTFKTFQATELQDKFISLSENDLLDDLDFMHDETTKIQILMNVMKQKGETERYDFYNDLISVNIHKMFQFPSKEDYDRYIDKIRQITEKDKEEIYNKRVNEIKEIEKLVWT